MTARVLFLGDVFGKPGRRAIQRLLPRLIGREQISFVIANCENVADGAGVDAKGVAGLLESGVDVLTSGNHIWRRREALELVESEPRLLRPVNFPAPAPGRGADVFRGADGVAVDVINLLGRVFMEPVDCPFQAADAWVEQRSSTTPSLRIVDMHAEASSEKAAMGWHLAGRVSAVLGTHTHVQTADERILPGGTAYISDVGMCGPIDSVIGSKAATVVARFRSRLPGPLEVASGPCIVQGVVVDIDTATGRAEHIQRVQERVE